MTTTSPSGPAKLTDRNALLRNRRLRIREDAMFLHQQARLDVEDRLSMVNRSFTNPAIVTGHPDLWGDILPEITVVVDENILSLQESRHDLVIHAMCLHWADDPIGQLIQCRRALVPDGLLIAILPGGQTLAELRACLAQAEAVVRGGLSPRILPMADIRDLGALLQRAGLTLPVADSLALRVEYDDMTSLMRDVRAMGEGNALAAREKRFSPRALFEKAAEFYQNGYAGTEKPVFATFELIALSGWAPDASQPQPLRPGSARTRLSEALGVDETSLPD